MSLASLNTSRDIFQESLHINVSTYHCLYYLPIDKKFLLYSEHEQVIKYNMNVYILWKSVPDKSVSKVDLQRGKKKKKVLGGKNMVNSFDDTCKH